MPVVLRVAGCRFFFFSNENEEPPHIHVASGEKAAKFWLDPVELANVWGFRAHEISKLRALVAERRDALLEVWNDHLGD